MDLRRRFSRVALLAVAGIVITACGGSDAEPDSGAAPVDDGIDAVTSGGPDDASSDGGSDGGCPEGIADARKQDIRNLVANSSDQATADRVDAAVEVAVGSTADLGAFADVFPATCVVTFRTTDVELGALEQHTEIVSAAAPADASFDAAALRAVLESEGFEDLSDEGLVMVGEDGGYWEKDHGDGVTLVRFDLGGPALPWGNLTTGLADPPVYELIISEHS